MRALKPLLLASTLGAMTPLCGQTDTALWRDPVKGPYKLRAIGGIAGVTLENHGPMGVERFAQFTRGGLPPVQGDPGDYYFGYTSTAIGGSFGPRLALARLRDGANSEHGWTMHLGVQPRLFFLYLRTDSLLGDTARTVEYLYGMSQMEVAVGGGPYWSLFLSNSFFLRPGLLAELGHAGRGSVSVRGTRTDAVNGTVEVTDLLDRSVAARACTYLRASACLGVGFRIRKRVDLGVRGQWGTGLMWLHGVDVRQVLSTTLYALDLAFLIRR